MSEKYTFTVLGGDRRQVVIAKRLVAMGHTVRIYGLGDLYSEIAGAELFLSLEKAVMGCDIVLLPLPVSRDGETLNLVSCEKKDCPTLDQIVRYTSKNSQAIILGGLIPPEMQKTANELGVRTLDYYKNESLQLKNALPSAEGAIMIAMENSDKVLEGMSVLVSGYGRIASLLADKLKKLGADVYVCARRDEVLCEIAMSGYRPVHISDMGAMHDAIVECDVVFNTVPGLIFTKQILDGIDPKPLYIEIASTPGGIDIPCARDLGYKILFAPSLPGKYAPTSAGEYIFETIYEILEKGGVNI